MSEWKLIDKTGAEVAIGTEVKTFRGEPVTVTGFEAPHYEASTGRVYVKDAGGFTSGFFPSVCDLQIVRREL